MPSLAEIVRALYGVWLIARRDPRAVLLFDDSVRGFWQSFFAAVIALPAYAVNAGIDGWSGDGASLGIGGAIQKLEIYVILWIAYPLAIWFVLQSFNRTERFMRYVVAYNWAAVPVAYLLMAGSLLDFADILPSAIPDSMTLYAYVVAFIYMSELTKRALDIGAGIAIGVVLFDVVFSAGLARVLSTFMV